MFQTTPTRLTISDKTITCRGVRTSSTASEADSAKCRKEPVRFDSFRFRTFRQFTGSVRFGSVNDLSQFDAARPAFFGRVVRPAVCVEGVAHFGVDEGIREHQCQQQNNQPNRTDKITNNNSNTTTTTTATTTTSTTSRLRDQDCYPALAPPKNPSSRDPWSVSYSKISNVALRRAAGASALLLAQLRS